MGRRLLAETRQRVGMLTSWCPRRCDGVSLVEMEGGGACWWGRRHRGVTLWVKEMEGKGCWCPCLMHVRVWECHSLSGGEREGRARDIYLSRSSTDTEKTIEGEVLTALTRGRNFWPLDWNHWMCCYFILFSNLCPVYVLQFQAVLAIFRVIINFILAWLWENHRRVLPHWLFPKFYAVLGGFKPVFRVF